MFRILLEFSVFPEPIKKKKQNERSVIVCQGFERLPPPPPLKPVLLMATGKKRVFRHRLQNFLAGQDALTVPTLHCHL